MDRVGMAVKVGISKIILAHYGDTTLYWRNELDGSRSLETGDTYGVDWNKVITGTYSDRSPSEC